MPKISTFDLKILMKEELAHDADARKRLEAYARDKLAADARKAGHDPILGTFRVRWEDLLSGVATVDAVKRSPK